MRRHPMSASVAVCAAGVAAAVLAGCGGLSAPTATVTQTTTAPAEGDPTDTASPEPAATPTPTVDPTEVATMAGGNGMSLPLMLDDSFLPVGWNRTQPRDSGGFRMTICGVDLEPAEPIDHASAMWQRSPTGPWLEQHVRVYDNGTARNVLAALKEAVPGCETYTATDANGGSSTFQVFPLTLRSGDNNTVSWRQRLVPPPETTTSPAPAATATATAQSTATAQATGAPARTGTPTASEAPSTAASAAPTPTARPTLTQDVAVARIGSSTVMLVSYAVDENPSVALLDAALSAVQVTR